HVNEPGLNNLGTDVFTPTRISVLKLLASEAAKLIWRQASPKWEFDDATYEQTAALRRGLPPDQLVELLPVRSVAEPPALGREIELVPPSQLQSAMMSS